MKDEQLMRGIRTAKRLGIRKASELVSVMKAIEHDREAWLTALLSVDFELDLMPETIPAAAE